MPTELQIAQGFQTLFLAMDEFAAGDVTINDETIYDGAAMNCPYLIIYTATEFELTPASSRTISRLTIPVMHIEAFDRWETTMNSLRNTRQAMFDEVFTGAGMSANGLEGTLVTAIRNLSDIEGVSYADSDAQTSPIYLQQLYGIEVELF